MVPINGKKTQGVLAIGSATILILIAAGAPGATADDDRTMVEPYILGWERFSLLVCPPDQGPDPDGTGTVCFHDPFIAGDTEYSFEIHDDIGFNVPYTYRVWGQGGSQLLWHGTGCGTGGGLIPGSVDPEDVDIFEVVLWGVSGAVFFCAAQGTGAIMGEIHLTPS